MTKLVKISAYVDVVTIRDSLLLDQPLESEITAFRY